MKFLILSECGDLSGGALRLLKEKHEVKLFLQKNKGILDGIVEKVSSIEEGVKFGPDYIVVDGYGWSKEASKLKADGWKIVGWTPLHDELRNVQYASKAMETFGIKTPKTFYFDTLSDAVKFVMSYPSGLCFCAPGYDDYSFETEDSDELLNYLAQLQTVRKYNGPCVLKEKIHGTKVAIEIWYAAGKPISYPIGYFESYSFLGKTTRVPMGSVAFSHLTREPRLVQKSLKKIGILLDRKKYSGPLSVNGIVTQRGEFYGTSFHCGVRGGSIYATLSLLGEDFGDLLSRIGKGENFRSAFLSPGYACQLAVTYPPYPLSTQEPGAREIYNTSRDFYVDGIEKDAWGTEAFPHDLKAKAKGVVTGGVNGVACFVTGKSMSIYDAHEKAGKVARSIVLPCKQVAYKEIFKQSIRSVDELRGANYDVSSVIEIGVGLAIGTEEVENEREENVVPHGMANDHSFMPVKSE